MDIGLGREFLRHRPASPAQESTRYCNYNKKGLKITNHDWIDTAPDYCASMFSITLSMIELCYNTLINNGIRPELARDILPLTTNSQIVFTATVSEWKHIMKLRCAKDAHPEMQKLMKQVLAYFIDEYPDYFYKYLNLLDD